MEMPVSVDHHAKRGCMPLVMEHPVLAEQIASVPKERAPVVHPVSAYARGLVTFLICITGTHCCNTITLIYS